MNTDTITLDNCDREPIHIPGAIQSHGVLLAFDLGGRLVHYSQNAGQLLGSLPALSAQLEFFHLDFLPEAYPLIREYIDYVLSGESLLQTHELEIGDQVYDLVLHVSVQLIVAEFELRLGRDDNLNIYSIKAQKAINSIKKQKSMAALLDAAATEFRALTGFDRVMAYRFRYDGSGDIAAEAKRDDLDSLVGRRYPASDIPAQARRLYIENTLRLIADVNAEPVPVLGKTGEAPLDMSHCVLRSVSPIHIEYLQNMGVGASMSVSIVLNGKLWGMMACHHMSAHQVPYSIRMACDVLCHILASAIQHMETQENADRQIFATNLRAGMMLKLMEADDLSAAIFNEIDTFRVLLPSDAAFVSYGGKLHATENVNAELASSLIGWLNHNQSSRDFYHIYAVNDAPEVLQPLMGDVCGILALNVDQANKCWLVLFRNEQIHTVKWGGKPEKNYKPGPLGPRLTPRGSFEEWCETVKGQAEPWSWLDLIIARDLQMDLLKVCNALNAETERTRAQLMAVLGHDLRDPLNSITMAAQLMEMQGGNTRMSERIRNSSGRMQRLINQVLDMTRLHSGLGLGMTFIETDVTALVEDLIQENLTAYPDMQLKADIERHIHAVLDADRVAQVVANLISNARHHGEPGSAIRVNLRTDGDDVHIAVCNIGNPIPQDIANVLFDPFKRQALSNERNRTGLGLGLYIAHEIVKGHDGKIAYDYANSEIVFNVSLPKRRQ